MEKNLDSKGRWRNKIVAFRVSPEEAEQIDACVRLSGLSKQDYITKRLTDREIHLISHYYLVAEMFMSSKEVALDYAISQKILPCINGNGKQYKEFLNGLMTICKENQLNKSASIVSKILEKSEHEFYSFFSL